MLTEEMLTGIKRYVNEEEGQCIKYAQWLFDLDFKPKISVKTSESERHVATLDTTSFILPGEAVVNPLAVVNSLGWRRNLRYDWDLRRSCISHLSHEIGHNMHQVILGLEESSRYFELDYIIDNYSDAVFFMGVGEAVAYYNENFTLKQYGATDPLFRDRKKFDMIRLLALKEVKIVFPNIKHITDREKGSTFVRTISSQTQLLGREYYERKIKFLKPKFFRKWVKYWRPEKVNEKERNEYLTYLQKLRL